MLNIETGDRYAPLNMSPQRQKEKTIEAIAEQMAGIARHGRVLVIFEVAHWTNPTTLEVLEAVIGRIENEPMLRVITFRPEFEATWAQEHITQLALSRLPKRQCADMVAKVTGGKALPDEVMSQIVAKTDGVPLFVEELTKTVLEAGFLKDTGRAHTLDGPLPPSGLSAAGSSGRRRRGVRCRSARRSWATCLRGSIGGTRFGPGDRLARADRRGNDAGGRNVVAPNRSM